jgi:hypothetical protein
MTQDAKSNDAGGRDRGCMAIRIPAWLSYLVLGLVLSAAVAGTFSVTTAHAYRLSETAAEQASRAAVAPAPVELVRCYRQPGFNGKEARRRALCIVVHGTHDSVTCRSFVLVRTPRGPVASAGAVRASVLHSNVCLKDIIEIVP